MSRKVVLDNRRTICKNSSMAGFSTTQVKSGMWLTFNNAGETCNVGNGLVIGRIKKIEPDGLENCKGWLVVAALSQDATFFMERWVSPDRVLSAHPRPKHIKSPLKAREPNKALEIFRSSL